MEAEPEEEEPEEEEEAPSTPPAAPTPRGPVIRRRMREFLVKLRGYSYNKAAWMTADAVIDDGKLSLNAFAKFLRRLHEGEAVNQEYKQFSKVQRVIGHRNANGFTEFLVKWAALPYCECSWESEIDLHDTDAVARYHTLLQERGATTAEPVVAPARWAGRSRRRRHSVRRRGRGRGGGRGGGRIGHWRRQLRRLVAGSQAASAR